MDWKKVVEQLMIDADYLLGSGEKRSDPFGITAGGILGSIAAALEAGLEKTEDDQSPKEPT
jgi:hypothetical protein